MKIKQCKVEGCQRKYFANGYCNMHYERVRRGITDMRLEALTHKKGICSIAECGSPHAAKGYCLKHYMQFKYKAEGGKPCKFPECKGTHYAKGYCRKHHAILLAKGEVRYEHIEKKCLVPSCNATTTSKNGYCKFHNQRRLIGIPLNLPRQVGGGGKGVRNPRWNGGISQYPNHYELKKSRLNKLKSVNYLCEYCGEKARHVHHLDGSKTNHAIENLVAVCVKCHFSIFHKKSYISKYKKLYGFTAKELAKMGIYDKVRGIHKKLKQFKSTTLQAA